MARPSIPAHLDAAMATLGRVGPHYPDQACDWIIVLRNRQGDALEIYSLEVTRSGDDDPGRLPEMIGKAEDRMRDSGYRLGDRGPAPSIWAASWSIEDTSDVIDVEAL